MISKEELEKWAFQLNMDGDCDATDKDIETLITQALDTMEELETAKRCLPVDKEFEVRGSWIGSVQNYIVHLEESLKDATAYIEKLREWNAGLAQESFERQERIVELTAGKVGSALLERENHHAKVVEHLVDLIIELKAKLSESSGNAFKEAYESGRTRHVPETSKPQEDHPGWFQSEEEKEDAIKNIQQGLDVVKSRASECWDGIYGAIKGRGKRSEGDFTPDLSMSVEEIIEAINNRHANSIPDSDNACIIVKWIPVSERLPENKPGSYKYLVFETLTNHVSHDYWNVPGAGQEFTPFWNHYGDYVTHWMPLPAGPKEQDNV